MKILDFSKKYYLLILSIVIIMNIISFIITKFEIYYLVGIIIFGLFSFICNFIEFKIVNREVLSSRSKFIFFRFIILYNSIVYLYMYKKTSG